MPKCLGPPGVGVRVGERELPCQRWVATQGIREPTYYAAHCFSAPWRLAVFDLPHVKLPSAAEKEIGFASRCRRQITNPPPLGCTIWERGSEFIFPVLLTLLVVLAEHFDKVERWLDVMIEWNLILERSVGSILLETQRTPPH